MRAIHMLCRRDKKNRLKNVNPAAEKNVYVSAYWPLKEEDDPATLIGGWLYLHPKKEARSEIGGIIRSYDRCKREGKARENGIAFTFESRREGRGQRWRGENHDRAWTGRIVVADYKHESG